MAVRDIRVEKDQVRRQCRQYREQLSAGEKRKLDTEIQSRFLALREYAGAGALFLYVSKEIEVDTHSLIGAAWANGKRVAVPRCVPETREMEFYWIRVWEDLEEGAFGVLEPIPGRCTLVEGYQEGLCVVPGLSFDAEGYRLGYGKGYYDRFLSRFGGRTVGLCYQECMRWRLPHGRYDRPVEILVTERYIRNTAKKA